MSASRRVALLLALLLPAFAGAAERKKVAVLEYRAGVVAAPALAQRLADRLKKTAALVVIDPAEARRRDASIDAQVARCSGDAACAAGMGVTLDTDEVLLVAVSQLGDLVLNLQRIDVAAGEVSTQVAEVLPVDGELADERLDGWLRRLYPPEVFKRYGFIAVSASIDGAAVSINGQARGETPLESPIKVLAPRSYRVTLVKKGYLPFSARIDVVPDANVEVRAELAQETASVSWYKRWYVWAAVGGVVAGGAIGTALYLTRPDDTRGSGFVVLPEK